MTKIRSGRKLGLVAFPNNSGLGSQTRRLAQMLNPERIMIIDPTSFSPNKQFHIEWYVKYPHFICHGLPGNQAVLSFIPNLTHILVCENPYNFGLIYWAQKQGIKVYVQSNYEFCENLSQPWLPVPDKFLMPSYWKIEEMEKLFGKDRIMYLPPPINPDEFKRVREINLARKGKPRFLHIIGTLVSNDRNGTLDLLEAVKLTKSDFELVIHSQHPLPMEYFLDDKRVSYQLENKEDNASLYEDFDALILPRRFGGLSLTTNEALMSGLPVIMTDISPNNKLLPSEFLVESDRKGEYFGRSKVDLYSAKHDLLAQKIDWLVKQDLPKLKMFSFELGMKNFSEAVLKPQYDNLFR